MFWLIRKIFTLGVLAALVFLALQFSIGGKPLKDHLLSFYRSPLVGAAIEQGRDFVLPQLQKLGLFKNETPSDSQHIEKMNKQIEDTLGDQLEKEDREELDKVLKKLK